MVRGDVDCVMWCTLVWPVVNQATGVGVDVEYVALCDKYQDVFQDPCMPTCRQLDHAIDLIDESLPLPKHWLYRLSQAKHAEVKQQVEQLLERGWMRHYADIAAPMADLASPKRPWTWGADQDRAFDQLHELLCNPPVL